MELFRFGRKILLVVSDLTMTIAMVGMAVFFKFKEGCQECQEDEGTVSHSKVIIMINMKDGTMYK